MQEPTKIDDFQNGTGVLPGPFLSGRAAIFFRDVSPRGRSGGGVPLLNGKNFGFEKVLPPALKSSNFGPKSRIQ